MKFNLLLRVARFSLYCIPTSLISYISSKKNALLSCRFILQTKSKERIYLKSPFFIKGPEYMMFGGNFSSGPGLRMECWDSYGADHYSPSLTVGKNVHFNYRCHIGVINKIVIGNNVLVGSNVLITDHSHGNTSVEDIEIMVKMRCKLDEFLQSEHTARSDLMHKALTHLDKF